MPLMPKKKNDEQFRQFLQQIDQLLEQPLTIAPNPLTARQQQLLAEEALRRTAKLRYVQHLRNVRGMYRDWPEWTQQFSPDEQRGAYEGPLDVEEPQYPN